MRTNISKKEDYQPAIFYWASDDIILKHANPVALEISEIWDDLLKKRARAISVESARENFLTKHCNIIYQGAGTESFIDIKDLQRCRVNKIDWTGREVYVGVDLSMSNDNTAVAICAEENGRILADVVCFIPEGRIDEKNKFEKLDYRRCCQRGISRFFREKSRHKKAYGADFDSAPFTPPPKRLKGLCPLETPL